MRAILYIFFGSYFPYWLCSSVWDCAVGKLVEVMLTPTKSELSSLHGYYLWLRQQSLEGSPAMGRRQMRGTLGTRPPKPPLAVMAWPQPLPTDTLPSYLSGTFELLSQVVPGPPKQTITERVLMVSFLSLGDKTVIRGSGHNMQPKKKQTRA